ncbi:1,2-epoxyphenylacetyl-CoA isomerase [Paraburkholderia sediminicola]|uniref:1,2-epoxyphenylacetyl-CoA isomerase n=1 Tax=Paraburkholderia sediminicola TaxID=458836 RepID=A0A6J5CT65_9BURK|nr:enoyl-CoA hydratase-related protein [Paraburkholderia sediminicola]CAB3744170.1 1,2-epoxyphenylacetyl-CoA isomerase [Paraburkholderia sediminicola]
MMNQSALEAAPILVRKADGVAEIVLNRPPSMNALTVEMARQLSAACAAIAADSTTRAVVLRGAGRGFCVGADVRLFGQDMDSAPLISDQMIEALNEAVILLGEMPQPTIASLQGPVAGAGVSLALACDIAIAARNVSLNAAYTRIGTCVDVGISWHLPRIVGLRKATEILLQGDAIDAEEAMRLGLVNTLVQADELESETMALAQHYAHGPTRAFRTVKQLLKRSFDKSLREQLEDERRGFGACATTSDFREGVHAFLGKRAPLFTGS